MDRAALADQLVQAAQHVASGECNISRQRERIAALVRDGLDPVQATKWLSQFEYMQARHFEALARLQAGLSARE